MGLADRFAPVVKAKTVSREARLRQAGCRRPFAAAPGKSRNGPSKCPGEITRENAEVANSGKSLIFRVGQGPHFHQKPWLRLRFDDLPVCKSDQEYVAASILSESSNTVILHGDPSGCRPDEPLTSNALRLLAPAGAPKPRRDLQAKSGLRSALGTKCRVEILVGNEPRCEGDQRNRRVRLGLRSPGDAEGRPGKTEPGRFAEGPRHPG